MSNKIIAILDSHSRDLGDFSVRRLLPALNHRMVGPFVFFDHFGPVHFAPGQGMEVRPHPHIGLATVTYLYDGAIVHRDSLGNRQTIVPGDVNWMTAGRGIVHSERSSEQDRSDGSSLHGIQTWVALPIEQAECDADFNHHVAQTLPQLERDGVTLRLIAGFAFGLQSPVATRSALFYVDVQMPTATQLRLDAEHEQRAIYVVEGSVTIEEKTVQSGQMAIFATGGDIDIVATESARLMLFGGAPLGDRIIWWNFVASSHERIEQAKAAWSAQAMGRVPDEHEFIPLPLR